MADRADERALLIYDGDCAFCRLWVEAWREETGDRVIYAPSREIAEKFPDIPRAKYRRAVQLIDVDGRRLEGAQAVFRVLSHAPGRGWLIKLYEAPLVAPVSEWAYGLVSRHRAFFLRAAKLLWGPKITRPRYGLTSWIFLRALAIVYLAAFLSWLPQLPGLIGPDGILPAGASASIFQLAALLGASVSIAAFAGFFVGPMFVAAWILYFIVASAAGDFAAYQWDGLLLEAGFLAIFFAPFRAVLTEGGRSLASPIVVWLYRFLLFRVMFSSGIAKLLSGDPSWRNLTALTHHFETQPLPTPIAWSAHHLPAGLLKAGALGTIAIELVVPLLFFMPRRARFVGAAIAAAFQLSIIATGNYAFFNWLTLALCLMLLDDGAIERLVPRWKTKRKPEPAKDRRLSAAFAALVVVIGLAQMASPYLPVWRPAAALAAAASRLRVVNAYSMFGTVTASRQEVVIEGSADGIEWKTYGFRRKPGDVKRAPGFTAPFQPRLDWHMWFAAVAPPEANPWFARLMVRLLQGSDPVLALFAEDPFPDAPPAYVRATLYRYRFTTPEERKLDGAWWRAAMRVEYFPQTTLNSF